MSLQSLLNDAHGTQPTGAAPVSGKGLGALVASAKPINQKLQQLQAQEEEAKARAQKANSFGGLAAETGKGLLNAGGAILGDALNSTLVTAADRTAEAVGRTGILGSTIKRGYEAQSQAGEGRDYSLPGVPMAVPALKSFGQGAGAQIASQGLKAASYLAPAGPINKATGNLVKGQYTKAAVQGGAAGGAYGALGGAGTALGQDNPTWESVAKETALGGLLGAAFGATLGAGAGLLAKNRLEPSYKLPVKAEESVGAPNVRRFQPLPVKGTSRETPVQMREAYTPESKLPVIQMGAKPKDTLPVIRADAPKTRGEYSYEPIKDTSSAAPNLTRLASKEGVSALKADTSVPFDSNQITLYHATGAKFDKFDPKFRGSNTGEIASNVDQGFFFSDDLKHIEDFKNSLARGGTNFRGNTLAPQDVSKYRVIEKVADKTKFLSLNPKTIIAGKLPLKDAEALSEILGTESGEILKGKAAQDHVRQVFRDMVPGEDDLGDIMEHITTEAKKRGYLGIKTDFGGGVDEYVVFDPNKLPDRSPSIPKELEPLAKQTRSSGAPVAVSPKSVEGTGEVKVRGLSAGVEAKAVEKKLTQTFGELPAYRTVNMKDQAQKATELVKADYARARRIAMGDELPPEGVIPEAVFTAVENKAIKEADVLTLRDLSVRSNLTSEATTMGQRIRTLAERDADSPVVAINEIARIRKEVVSKRVKDTKRVIGQTVAQIKTEIKKSAPVLRNWDEFVDSITC